MKTAFFNDEGIPVSAYQGVPIDRQILLRRGILFPDDADPFAYWLSPGAGLVRREMVELTTDKTRLIADGLDVASISGLPADVAQPAEITSLDANVIVVKLTGKYDSNALVIRAEPYEVWLAELRAARNAKLTACDWTAVPDNDLTPEQRAAWAAYRKALRDLAANQPRATLDSVYWPSSPE
jgi:hypothetical protein